MKRDQGLYDTSNAANAVNAVNAATTVIAANPAMLCSADFVCNLLGKLPNVMGGTSVLATLNAGCDGYSPMNTRMIDTLNDGYRAMDTPHDRCSE